MKLPKEILLYLLTLEMLPLLDEVEVATSHKKAVRTIENFASKFFEDMSINEELADYVNDDLVQAFSQMIDSIELEK